MTRAISLILVPGIALALVVAWVEGDVGERAIFAVLGIAVFIASLVAYFVLAAADMDRTQDNRARRVQKPPSTPIRGIPRTRSSSTSDGGAPRDNRLLRWLQRLQCEQR